MSRRGTQVNFENLVRQRGFDEAVSYLAYLAPEAEFENILAAAEERLEGIPRTDIRNFRATGLTQNQVKAQSAYTKKWRRSNPKLDFYSNTSTFREPSRQWGPPESGLDVHDPVPMRYKTKRVQEHFTRLVRERGFDYAVAQLAQHAQNERQYQGTLDVIGPRLVGKAQEEYERFTNMAIPFETVKMKLPATKNWARANPKADFYAGSKPSTIQWHEGPDEPPPPVVPASAVTSAAPEPDMTTGEAVSSVFDFAKRVGTGLLGSLTETAADLFSSPLAKQIATELQNDTEKIMPRGPKKPKEVMTEIKGTERRPPDETADPEGKFVDQEFLDQPIDYIPPDDVVPVIPEMKAPLQKTEQPQEQPQEQEEEQEEEKQEVKTGPPPLTDTGPQFQGPQPIVPPIQPPLPIQEPVAPIQETITPDIGAPQPPIVPQQLGLPFAIPRSDRFDFGTTPDPWMQYFGAGVSAAGKVAIWASLQASGLMTSNPQLAYAAAYGMSQLADIALAGSTQDLDIRQGAAIVADAQARFLNARTPLDAVRRVVNGIDSTDFSSTPNAIMDLFIDSHRSGDQVGMLAQDYVNWARFAQSPYAQPLAKRRRTR